MKILPIIITAAALAAPAMAGYRDLKREMADYTPPAMLRAPLPAPPPTRVVADASDDAMATIQRLRERWENAVNHPSGAIWRKSPLPAVAAAATDARQTTALLRQDFSLEVVEALIVQRNPSVKAASNRFRAALEGFDQVTALEEILLQYAAFTEGVMAGVGPMVGMDGIGTKFPYPGVAALKGQVVDQNVAALKQTLDMTLRDRLAEGRKAYWNLLYVHRARQITRDMHTRLRHLESVATTRYGAGRTSYQDVVKIRIGREKLSEQLNTLAAQQVNLQSELLALLDLPPGVAMGTPEHHRPGTSVPDLAALYPLALEHRQELVRMRAMVGKMERMVTMGETMIQPRFAGSASLFTDEAILQAGSVGMKPTFGTPVSPARGKGVPTNAWFGTRDAYLRETRRNLAALKAELADAEARTRLMVRTGWFDLDLASRERRLYSQRLLELSQTSLEVSTRGYESGNVSFADVIGAYNGWLEVSLASQRRNSDVGVARAELERRIGVPLP